MRHPILGILGIIITCIVTLYITAVTGYFNGPIMYIELGGCCFAVITIFIILITHIRGR